MTSLNDGIRIKGMKIRNRLVLPPLTTNYGSPEGFVTKDTLDFYDQRSKHVGLVIVEATAVHKNGRIVPNSLGLWDDAQIEPMAGLVRTIKKNGAVAVVQLNHAGSRCIPVDNEPYGFSPSNVMFKPNVSPLMMNKEQIEQLILDFEKAAVRAADAGFDGVEIHGAHLYLLSQFLSPLTNQRQDEYGGDLAGRAKLSVTIVRNVRQRLGQAYPVFFRLNAVEKIEGGLSLEHALEIGRRVVKAGADVLDVSLIAFGGFKDMDGKRVLVGSSALPKEDPMGANIGLAEIFREKINIPVIAVGKLWNGASIRKALEESRIDMVAVGRQMICDPESAQKLLNAQYDDIIPCQECLKCFATIGKGSPMACTVNKNLPL